MSGAEEQPSGGGFFIEQKCRVKATRNSKGEPQWEVVITEGFDADELERVRLAAVTLYWNLSRDLQR